LGQLLGEGELGEWSRRVPAIKARGEGRQLGRAQEYARKGDRGVLGSQPAGRIGVGARPRAVESSQAQGAHSAHSAQFQHFSTSSGHDPSKEVRLPSHRHRGSRGCLQGPCPSSPWLDTPSGPWGFHKSRGRAVRRWPHG